MDKYDIVIAGAGFAGIYSAWRLARAGKKVALVEAADYIGGNLKSREWNGYWLDNGTHNFDIRTSIGEEFYTDILGDNMLVFEDQPWACTTDKTWTDGFELPDFGVDDPEFSKAVLAELELIRSNGPTITQSDSYLEYYRSTYGNLLTDRLIPAMKKYTGSDPADFALASRGSMGMFSRPKLGTDAEMIALKQMDAFWDDRVGVSLTCGDKRFIGKNTNKRFAYPANKGLNGFCLSAHERLVDLGVDIYLSSGVSAINDIPYGVSVKAGEHTLEARKVFWSLPEVVLSKILGLDVDLMKTAIPVGTCFFAFEVPADSILGPDYLQDYSPDRLPYRYNRQGVYSNQVKTDGNTLVVTEAPCHPKDIKSIATEQNIDVAWDSALDIGFIKPGTMYTAATAVGHPVAYTLPKIGWRESYDKAQEQIDAHSKNIVGIEVGYRGRFSFMTFYETKLRHTLMDML
jgi:hypothetical protein